MKNNKKGFTLVEVIVSLAIIGIIATISIIMFTTNNSQDKKNKKLISKIESAAKVYFETNTTLLEEAQNNYGYKVLKIDDMKTAGILPSNQEMPVKDKENYSKMVIHLSDDEDNVGLTDYIYPYEANIPFIINLDDLYIESFEKDNLRCNSAENSSTNYTMQKIKYLNEEYTADSTENFYCGNLITFDALKTNNSNNADNLLLNSIPYIIRKTDKININNSGVIPYKVSYNANNNMYGTRNVIVNETFIPKMNVIVGNTGTKYRCGNWISGNQNIIISAVSDGKHNMEVSFIKDNNKELQYEKEEDGLPYVNIQESGLYTVDYKITGNISSEWKSYSVNCNISIDKEAPTINIEETDGVLTLNINDDGGSGVDKYFYSKIKKNKNQINFTKIYNKTSKPKINISGVNAGTIYYIYAIDKAGNISEKQYRVEGDDIYPEIKYEAIEGSYSKFKVTVNNIKKTNGNIDDEYNLRDIEVQYVPQIKIIETGNYVSNANTYKSNFSYNGDYNINKNSKPKNYTIINCSGSECSFTIDMDDFMNYCSSTKYCAKVTSYSDAYNLNIDYYIKAYNNKDKYREIKIASVLNIFEIEEAFNRKWYKYEKTRPTFIASNTDGDMLFSMKYGNRSDDWVELFFYKNNYPNISLNDLLKNKIDDTDRIDRFSGWKATYQTFDTQSLHYTLCNTYTRTTGSGKRAKTTKYKEYKIFDYEIDGYGIYETNYIDYNGKNSSSCNYRTNVKNSYTSVKYTKLPNYVYLRDYLTRLGNWEHNGGTTNYTKHSLDITTLKGNVLYRSVEVDGEDMLYNVLLITTSGKNGGDSSRATYEGMLYFLPEVTLTSEDLNKGTKSALQ